MGILSWIVMGLLAGALAQWIMPGKDPGGIIVTILIGIVGALIGGFLAGLLGIGEGRAVDFDLGSLILAVIGALILLWLYRKVAGRPA
ncbi:GlsB/YeaQ/YmgE family stress response membrane protein [Rhodothermus marinus]|uniref:GlsB/YeaQ/YmgE family stress response membrane protein n=1 Tax=Rhodothermus marinus TaxID=29549 RepID=UPI0012BA3E40|nr:GlsB/YeaQ/YmgE family stress response membrane protein [Rhodothermus marinus]BBM71252.1 membrane protein [Rhodothermus marinus]